MTLQSPPPALPDRSRHVVIIGGGLSGAALAWHLARESGADGPAITLVEPREAPGQGLAYGTKDPDHRLNVPDFRMTLETAWPESFSTWLANHGVPEGARAANGDIYPPRALFGAYVADKLGPDLASGRIRHLRDHGIAAAREGSFWRIRLASGAELRASELVLAATHPAPGIPRELALLEGSDRLLADPYSPDSLVGIAPDERLAIIGTGLTGADLLASLIRQGHQGPVTLISRHGRRSQPHGPAQEALEIDFSANPPRTARALLRRIREELARETAKGRTWHPLFDQIRAQGPVIWAALPLQERRRLVRHLRGLWDIHRFRIAPQTHQIVEDSLASGQAQLLAGRMRALRQTADGLELTLGHKNGSETLLQLDRILLATGPSHGSVTRANPLYADLARQGLLRSDPLGLGLDCTAEGLAFDATGRANPHLRIAGPLARAAVGELMGVPEVTHWAEKLARSLAKAPAET